MKFRNVIIAVLALLFLCSCTKSEPTPADPGPRQTLIMYMLGANNLAGHLATNVEQAMSSIDYNFPDNADLYIFFESYSGANIYKVQKPTTKGQAADRVLLKSFEGTDAITGSTAEGVRTVLEYILAQETTPAETYGIILSSHGTGWIPSSMRYIDELNRMPGRETASPEHDFTPAEGAAITRYFGQTNNTLMDISELVEGLSVIDFDYMIFDACFMTSVEALYDMRNCADYIVASPTEIMGPGFPMHKVIPLLFDYRYSVAARAASAAEAFYSFYANGETGYGSYKSASIAVVDCAKMDALADAVRNVYSKGIREVDPTWIQPLEKIFNHVFYDLDNYILSASKYNADYIAFRNALSDVVLYSNNTPTIYSGFSSKGVFNADFVCGLSTYIVRPTQFPITATAWYDTAWAKYIIQ